MNTCQVFMYIFTACTLMTTVLRKKKRSVHCAVSCSYITVAYVATMYIYFYITCIHTCTCIYHYFSCIFLLYMYMYRYEQTSAIRYLFFLLNEFTFYAKPSVCLCAIFLSLEPATFVHFFSKPRGCNVCLYAV